MQLLAAEGHVWSRHASCRRVGSYIPLRDRHEGVPAPGKRHSPEHDSCFQEDMLDQDYFGFCTTLKPLELKALGQLSRVQHLAEGEIVYSTGDPGDAIYIISRGVVEVIQASAQKSAPAAYLSRGDVLGDVEALSGLPRTHVVRTCELVSLQCFKWKDFPELFRRVPSFFYYIISHHEYLLSLSSNLMLTYSHYYVQC